MQRINGLYRCVQIFQETSLNLRVGRRTMQIKFRRAISAAGNPANFFSCTSRINRTSDSLARSGDRLTGGRDVLVTTTACFNTQYNLREASMTIARCNEAFEKGKVTHRRGADLSRRYVLNTPSRPRFISRNFNCL